MSDPHDPFDAAPGSPGESGASPTDSTFDAPDPALLGGPLAGDDLTTAKQIRQRTSPVTKIIAVLLLGVVAGGGYFAYTRSVASETRMDVFGPIAAMEDESQRNAALREVLSDASFEDVKQKAIMNLGHFRDTLAVPQLITSLDQAGVVRRSAAWALGNIGLPDARPALPKLLEVLPDTDERDKNQVVWTLALLRAQDQAAIDAIIEGFSRGQLQAIDGFDARVITEVLGLERLSSADLTGSESEAVRLLTAQALAEVGSTDVVTPLQRMLTNELGKTGEARSSEVVRAAVAGLGRTGDPSGARPLFAALQEEPNLRGTVLDALRASTSAKDIAVLAEEAEDDEVRRDITTLMAESHDRRVVDALAGLLGDSDLDVRATAALALAGFGDERATPVLFEMTEVEDNADMVSDALEHFRFVATPEISRRLADMIDTHTFRRSAILRALGATGDPAAARYVAEELDGDDGAVAARALAELDHGPSFDKLLRQVERPSDLDMTATNAAERSVVNEDVLRARKAAIKAMGYYGRNEAIEGLMAVVEDDKDDYELRGAAATAIGQIGDLEALRDVLAKVRDESLSEAARRYYVQALWQRPRKELDSLLLDLMESRAPNDVRRAAALALGYAAEEGNDARLVAMLGDRTVPTLEDPSPRRNAAIAISLGGGEEAVAALLEVLAVDGDTREVLQNAVMNEENDWFNLITTEMFEEGAVWSRLRAAEQLREGDGRNTYSYAWAKAVSVLRSGWDGVGGMQPQAIRDALYDALTGARDDHRGYAAAVLAEMPERGLLLRARDEGGDGGEAARAALNAGRR